MSKHESGPLGTPGGASDGGESNRGGRSPGGGNRGGRSPGGNNHGGSPAATYNQNEPHYYQPQPQPQPRHQDPAPGNMDTHSDIDDEEEETCMHPMHMAVFFFSIMATIFCIVALCTPNSYVITTSYNEYFGVFRYQNDTRDPTTLKFSDRNYTQCNIRTAEEWELRQQMSQVAILLGAVLSFVSVIMSFSGAKPSGAMYAMVVVTFLGFLFIFLGVLRLVYTYEIWLYCDLDFCSMARKDPVLSKKLTGCTSGFGYSFALLVIAIGAMFFSFIFALMRVIFSDWYLRKASPKDEAAEKRQRQVRKRYEADEDHSPLNATQRSQGNEDPLDSTTRSQRRRGDSTRSNQEQRRRGDSTRSNQEQRRRGESTRSNQPPQQQQQRRRGDSTSTRSNQPPQGAHQQPQQQGGQNGEQQQQQQQQQQGQQKQSSWEQDTGSQQQQGGQQQEQQDQSRDRGAVTPPPRSRSPSKQGNDDHHPPDGRRQTLAPAAGGTGVGGPSDDDLPAGNWVWDAECKLYWSEDEFLYLDPDTKHYYDPKSDQWYNPETDQWYEGTDN